MKLLRSVKVYNRYCDIVISDDDVALREAGASLKATIAILGNISPDISFSRYAVEDVEDIDEEFLHKVACRHLNLPVSIGKISGINIREMVLEDFENLLKVPKFPFKNKKDFKDYIPIHYDLYGYGLYLLENEKDIAGLAGFYNEDSKCYISYMLCEKYRRRGYGFEICKYLLNYLYEKTGIEEVYAKIDSDNTASLKLAEKLGVKIDKK